MWSPATCIELHILAFAHSLFSVLTLRFQSRWSPAIPYQPDGIYLHLRSSVPATRLGIAGRSYPEFPGTAGTTRTTGGSRGL